MNENSFTWDEATRPEKASVREAIFELAQRRGVTASTYLCLPGWDAKHGVGGLCIKKAKEKGVVTLQTKVIGYEWEPAFATEIQAHLDRELPGYNIEIRGHDVMEAELKPRSIDFVYLDLMGKITSRMYTWMLDTLIPAFTPNATLALTVAFGRQEGRLFEHVQRLLKSGWFKEEFNLFLKDFFPAGVPILVGTQFLILRCMLRDYHAHVTVAHTHGDKDYDENGKLRPHGRMMTFVFENIRPLRVNEPRKFPMLPIQTKGETLMTVRSRAAFKAHATRRANALAAKRSAAARKAWRTRRSKSAHATA